MEWDIIYTSLCYKVNYMLRACYVVVSDIVFVVDVVRTSLHEHCVSM